MARTVTKNGRQGRQKKNEGGSDDTEEQDPAGNESGTESVDIECAKGTPAKRKKSKGSEGRDHGREHRGRGGSGGGSAKKMKAVKKLPFPLKDT